MVRLSVGLYVTIVDSGLRVDPKNHVFDGMPGRSRSPMRMGNFEGEKGRPIVKYWDPLASVVSAKTTETMSCLGCGLGWAQGSILYLPLMGTH